MPFTVTLEFAGLCLFVQRVKTNPGLIVLLPLEKTHGHKTKVTMGGDTARLSGIVDWRHALKPGTKPVKLNGAIHLSKVTGGGRIARAEMDESLTRNVVARLELPYPEKDPNIYSENVLAEARYYDANGNYNSGQNQSLGRVAGILTLAYAVNTPISIGPFKITGDTTLKIENTPSHGGPVGHPKGKKMEHAETMLSLVQGGTKTPAFHTSEDYTPGPLSTSKTASDPATAFFWVDPVMCTVGQGCSDDDPEDCT